MVEVVHISLVDFKSTFEDVERVMDIWDWLVYNGHVLVEGD